MPFSDYSIDQPGCDIRPPRMMRLSVWSEPYSGAGRFALLPPEREAELRLEAAERLRRLRPVKQKAQPEALPFHPRHQASGSLTYMIGAEGSSLVKIGWAKAPESRVSALQTGSPLALSLLWFAEGPYEGPLHRKFKDYRVRGEWFDLTPLGDPVEVVKAAVDEIKAAETTNDS